MRAPMSRQPLTFTVKVAQGNAPGVAGQARPMAYLADAPSAPPAATSLRAAHGTLAPSAFMAVPAPRVSAAGGNAARGKAAQESPGSRPGEVRSRRGGLGFGQGGRGVAFGGRGGPPLAGAVDEGVPEAVAAVAQLPVAEGPVVAPGGGLGKVLRGPGRLGSGPRLLGRRPGALLDVQALDAAVAPGPDVGAVAEVVGGAQPYPVLELGEDGGRGAGQQGAGAQGRVGGQDAQDPRVHTGAGFQLREGGLGKVDGRVGQGRNAVRVGL